MSNFSLVCTNNSIPAYEMGEGSERLPGGSARGVGLLREIFPLLAGEETLEVFGSFLPIFFQATTQQRFTYLREAPALLRSYTF